MIFFWMSGNTKKNIDEFVPNFDDEELFSSYENINTHNRTSERGTDKVVKNAHENKSRQLK